MLEKPPAYKIINSTTAKSSQRKGLVILQGDTGWKVKQQDCILQPLAVKTMRRLQLSGFDSNYHRLVQIHLRFITDYFVLTHTALGSITLYPAVPTALKFGIPC